MSPDTKSMRILITGSNGLLGQKIISLLGSNPDFFFGNNTPEVFACSRGENRLDESGYYQYISLDLSDRFLVNKIIHEIRPDCVIHTAAMTNVDACELNTEECQKHNIDATQNIIDSAKELKKITGINIHLIHLSTDFIFDGENGPYREEDLPNPLSVYGKSKLEAENIMLESGLDVAIVRTIIVYGVTQGMSRSNLVLWVADSLSKGKDISVVTDQFRSPTLAEDLACGCLLIAASRASGIFHLSGPDTYSIFELANTISEVFKLPKERISPIESKTLNQPAKRPPRTGFIIEKARKTLGYDPMTFKQGVLFVKQQLEGENPEYIPRLKK